VRGFTRWVEHWRGEVRRLLGELEIVLIHEITGFEDREKTLAEVLRYLREKAPIHRRLAEAAIRRDFQAKRLRQRGPGRRDRDVLPDRPANRCRSAGQPARDRS
jgi:hypothetical protein